jgi:membrane-bound lytic murein transglycosylase D
MKINHHRLLTLFTIAALLTLLTGCGHFKPATNTQTQDKPSSDIQEPATVVTEPQKSLKPGQNSDGTYNNIWNRVSNGFGFPAIENNQINEQLRWFSQYQQHLTFVVNQSQPYLHYVVSEMEAKGLPLELVLIPVIESSYNPVAVSPGKNVGLWQFTWQTGKNFGLIQNSSYNGRKDAVASTDAAIRYLQALGKMFNHDWLLAVAAYNAGEGTIGRAIAKNKRAGKPTDFWSLSLPKHTRVYIPKLLALAKIIAEPARYHLTIPVVADTPYFAQITLDKQIDLAQAAKQLDMDASTLKKLNSGLNGWLTEPSGRFPLLVPVADAEKFTQQLANLPTATPSRVKEHQNLNAPQDYYTVKAGDNLSSIAKAHKMSLSMLLQLNDLSTTSIIKIGKRLLVEQK